MRLLTQFGASYMRAANLFGGRRFHFKIAIQLLTIRSSILFCTVLALPFVGLSYCVQSKISKYGFRLENFLRIPLLLNTVHPRTLATSRKVIPMYVSSGIVNIVCFCPARTNEIAVLLRDIIKAIDNY